LAVGADTEWRPPAGNLEQDAAGLPRLLRRVGEERVAFRIDPGHRVYGAPPASARLLQRDA